MNPKIRDFFVLLLLTTFIPMGIYLVFGDLTSNYRGFDIGDFTVYAMIGLLSWL